jgi:hypothetical protein
VTIADEWPVVREGVWLCAGTSPVQVRVLRSKETWGTGDYEDDEVTRENQPVECFFLVYEMAGSPGNFCNLVPNLRSLGEAISHAGARFPGITWRTQA